MTTQREFRLAAWLVAFALLVFGPLGCSSASGGSSATEAADSGGSSGDGAAPRGCGQGTSCTAGSDLPAPPPDQGIQLETPDNAIVVQPNQEVFLCYYRTLPNTAAVDIGKMQSWMTLGSSHHFIAYEVGTGGGSRAADRSRMGRSSRVPSAVGRGFTRRPLPERSSRSEERRVGEEGR